MPELAHNGPDKQWGQLKMTTATRTKVLVAMTALIAALSLAGCSGLAPHSIENSPTCSSKQIKALAREIVSAKTTPIGKTLPFPLNYVMKDETDVVCSARATIDHGPQGGTQTFDVVVVSSTLKTVRAHIDKVLLAHGGARGTDSGQNHLSWTVQSATVMTADPFPGDKAIISVQP
ncbi:hypothetical protein [Glaciihabitans sp. UYNi722]|uniref:hypothetical protein n=1 Tax=Glaciihabitans sp. UYNi722 TaxID=3156344 RepID=UPI00339664DF